MGPRLRLLEWNQKARRDEDNKISSRADGNGLGTTLGLTGQLIGLTRLGGPVGPQLELRTTSQTGMRRDSATQRKQKTRDRTNESWTAVMQQASLAGI